MALPDRKTSILVLIIVVGILAMAYPVFFPRISARERLRTVGGVFSEQDTCVLLDGSVVTDKEIEFLGDMKALAVIRLPGTCITDGGLASLKNLTEVRELYLNRTAITDEGLANLSGWTKMEKLVLEGTRVTGKGLVN